MKLDWTFPLDLRSTAEVAVRAEGLGYSGLWTTDSPHDPFLPTLAAGLATTGLQVGTGIATAFTRSPMVTALTAWDLQGATNGRFMLGLGTQVKAHNARRYGTPVEHPWPQLREVVACIRHIWGVFQGLHPLRFEGEFYKLDLFSPLQSPGPIEHPDIPISLAAVKPGAYRLAGEVADGVQIHPYNTPEYLRAQCLPALERGLERAGRSRESFELIGTVLCNVGDDPVREQTVRRQIAFYGSTSAYRPVLEQHGWGHLAGPFREAVLAGDTDAMAAAVPDEVFETFAVVAPDWHSAVKEIHRRYDGLLDRVGIYALGGTASASEAEAVATAFAG